MDKKVQNKPEKKGRRLPELRESLIPFRSFRAALLGLLCAAVPTSVVRCVSLFRDYEEDVQYFKLHAALPTLFNAVTLLLCLCAFVLPFFLAKKDLPQKADGSDPATVFFALASGLLIAANGVLDAIAAAERASSVSYTFGDAAGFAKRLNVVTVPCVICAFAAALYFIVSAVRPKSKRLRTALGVGVVLFFIFKLLAIYYDTSAPINSPIKMLDQIAGAFGMLFAVAELRVLVSETRPRFYYRSGVITVLLMLPSAISQTVFFVSSSSEGSPVRFYALFELAFSLYAAARLVSSLFAKSELIPEPVDPENVVVSASEPEAEGGSDG